MAASLTSPEDALLLEHFDLIIVLELCVEGHPEVLVDVIAIRFGKFWVVPDALL